VRTHPDADAGGDVAAANAVAQALGEDHPEDLERITLLPSELRPLPDPGGNASWEPLAQLTRDHA
jgi:hypothetical protein